MKPPRCPGWGAFRCRSIACALARSKAQSSSSARCHRRSGTPPVRFKQRLYLLEEQAGGELLALQVSVYGVVAPLLKVIGHVGQGVVYLAAQQILAVVQLRKTHISSVADFLSA